MGAEANFTLGCLPLSLKMQSDHETDIVQDLSLSVLFFPPQAAAWSGQQPHHIIPCIVDLYTCHISFLEALFALLSWIRPPAMMWPRPASPPI